MAIVTDTAERIVSMIESQHAPAQRWIEIRVVTMRGPEKNDSVRILRLSLWELHRIAIVAGLDPTDWPETEPERT